jgi:hypothetical protein
MKGNILWRGLREKGPLFIQMLIEFTTSIGDVVMDCTTLTSVIIHSNLFFKVVCNITILNHWHMYI